MFTVLAISFAITAQQRHEVDGIQARMILEASRAADQWVFKQVHTRLVPDISIVQSSGRERSRRQAIQDSCVRDLTNAAYEQVCDAYHVSKKQFNAIVRNPQWALSFEYAQEVNVRRRFGRELSPWDRMGTRFDPKFVRLNESLADRYGYINPRKPEPPAPSLILEQLIGPSPLPREFTATAAKEAPKDDHFPGFPGIPRDGKKWKEQFNKRNGYVYPPGEEPHTRPSVLTD